MKTPVPDTIVTLALQAQVDADALPVLGDAVQELGWFDARVMQTMWPIRRAKRNGERTRARKQERAIARDRFVEGYREYFDAYAAKPTPPWARCILALALFGGWRLRGWPLTNRMPKYYGPPNANYWF